MCIKSITGHLTDHVKSSICDLWEDLDFCNIGLLHYSFIMKWFCSFSFPTPHSYQTGTFGTISDSLIPAKHRKLDMDMVIFLYLWRLYHIYIISYTCIKLKRLTSSSFSALIIQHHRTQNTCKRQGMPLISTKSQDLSPLIFNRWELRGYFVPSHRC